jgi:hypothetical protein
MTDQNSQKLTKTGTELLEVPFQKMSVSSKVPSGGKRWIAFSNYDLVVTVWVTANF